MTPEIAFEPASAKACTAALSRASFMRPRWFPPTAWVQHAPFAYFVTEALRPQSYVELGSHYGYSFMAVCQAVEAYRLPTRCVAIDTWQGDEHAGFYEDRVYNAVKGELDSHYPAFTAMMRMTFDEALPKFADGSIDLLHIDGRHFYDDARHDYETWQPKVAKAGIVMIHDTRVFERGFGVHRLWAEIADKYPSFEFHHGHGLGVAAVGGAVPEALAGLFEAARDPAVAADIRACYEHLGQALEPDAKVGRQAFKTGWKADAKRQAKTVAARLGLGK